LGDIFRVPADPLLPPLVRLNFAALFALVILNKLLNKTHTMEQSVLPTISTLTLRKPVPLPFSIH
jgi:hypothetical protein